jgi:hypothetical protein
MLGDQTVDHRSSDFSAQGGRNLVHVLVHVRLRHYSHLPRHPATLSQRSSLSFYGGYSDLCAPLQLSATTQKLDSKSADRKVVGVRPPPGTNYSF